MLAAFDALGKGGNGEEEAGGQWRYYDLEGKDPLESRLARPALGGRAYVPGRSDRRPATRPSLDGRAYVQGRSDQRRATRPRLDGRAYVQKRSDQRRATRPGLCLGLS